MENTIPKYAFDKEYATQWKREVEFLRGKGIEPAFIRRDNKYHIPKYKYVKTPELFSALTEFYGLVVKERESIGNTDVEAKENSEASKAD